MTSVVNAASSQEEAVNKARVVFGKAAESVIAFGDQAAESLGQSKTEAIAAAGAFGNMLITVGLAKDEAAAMSLELVKLASDMASFNDTDPAEMLDKLRSGLSGEAEPLRQFGVLLSEAEVASQAYKDGIAAVGAELTEAEKVQARYSLIMEQTAIQQGDFARTSDSLANQQRQLRASFTDLAAEIGESFVPFMQAGIEVLDVARPLLAFVGENAVILFAAFAAYKGLGYLPGLLNNITTALWNMGAALASAKVGGIATFLSANLGKLNVALAAVAAATLGWQIGTKQANAEVVAASRNLQNNVGFLIANRKAGESWKDTLQAITDTAPSWDDQMGVLGAGVEAFSTQLLMGKISQEQFNAALQHFAETDDPEKRAERLAAMIAILQGNTRDGVLDVRAFAQALRALGVDEKEVERLTGQFRVQVQRSGEVVQNFAGMTTEALKEFRTETKEAFGDASDSVAGFERKWSITSRQFLRNSIGMVGKSRELRAALREVANAKFVPEDYQAFLMQQGPDATVAFARLTKEQQREAVAAWKENNPVLADIRQLIDKITGKVREFGEKVNELPKTKDVDIRVRYHYEGYNPNMPFQQDG